MPNPQFLPGETLSAAKLQQLGNEGSVYVPTLIASTTDPTLGTGPDQTSNIWLNGRLVFIWLTIRFGTGATAGSGDYEIELPAAYPLVTGQEERPIGTARLFDSSSGNERTDSCVALPVSNSFELRGVDGLVTNAVPWIWADGDTMHCEVHYLTDFA